MVRHSSERGVALVAALLVMTMMSGMLAGFLVMVNADQAAGGIERDQTQAYAAAHAGVEKLTADLGQLFAGNFSPTGAQLANLTANAMEPNLQGIDYLRPDDTSGYRIIFEDDNADGNPDVENPGGSAINAGPFQGLRGLITPYTIEVTSRTVGDAEVRMRRTMQTIAIPVFQFGIFSENDLSFFAGPNFAFGGKVHTNQNLFLKQDGGGTLTLQDRVTAVGEVVRNRLSNGVVSHDGTVRVARNAGCPAAPTAINLNCFVLANNHGSVIDSLGSAANDPTWTNVSIGTSGGWLRNGRTGARRLDLPIVSDGATPVDLIRRPPVGEALNTPVARQRFYNMATLRVLLSDTAGDLTALPGVRTTAGVSPMRLAGALTPAAIPNAVPGTPNFAASTGVLGEGYRTHAGVPSIDGFILINIQDRNGNWADVTEEIMSLGFIGRRLSDGTIDRADLNNTCVDPHPNAVIRLQRVRDTISNAAGGCNGAVATNTAGSFWPTVLYDAREGMLRDDQGARPVSPAGTMPPGVANGQPRMFWGGVMHYVELDVRNFRRWLRSEIGTAGRAGCIDGAGGGGCPMDVTGYVLYFSDRRGNRTLGGDGAVETNYGAGGWVYADDAESGEFGFEDVINPGSSTSVPNGALDGPYTDVNGDDWFAEDVNFSGTLETYGGEARLLPPDAGVGTLTMRNHPNTNNYTPFNNQYFLYANPIDRNVARVNRAFFFRRALKLVNGGRGDLPANGTQGLTVASENAVYIQGNYNACVTSTTVPTQANGWSPACTGGVGFGNNPGNDHVSAAVIADAVTFLSNAWNDIRSFVNPYNAGISNPTNLDPQNKYNAREGRTTWYRVGLIAGKTLSFTRPTNNGNDHTDFGTDGGAHNFIRYIERWDGALNYRGSLISFYTSRQAIGTYKCCDIVYGPPTRGYNFDTDFLMPNLLPPRTPMFRDINTLTFRQILRPTQ